MKFNEDKANQLLRASLTQSQGASRNTNRILYGKNIANELEYEREKGGKRGVRNWLKKGDNRLTATIIVDIAINYFDFDPVNAETSLQNLDFNKFVAMLNHLGYDSYKFQVNKIVELLIDLKNLDLDYCTRCERPFIPHLALECCPRCMISSFNSAVSRYSESELEYKSSRKDNSN